MLNESSTAWGRGELYETLCLLVIGAGIWFVGVTLGTFDSVNAAMAAYGLNDLLMLAACMPARCRAKSACTASPSKSSSRMSNTAQPRARQPMSRRWKPPGQSIASTAA